MLAPLPRSRTAASLTSGSLPRLVHRQRSLRVMAVQSPPGTTWQSLQQVADDKSSQLGVALLLAECAHT